MNAERLLTLAQHLRTGKLGHDVFDFATFHEKNGCGTCGCALGECPVVWPAEWVWEGPRVFLRCGPDSACASAEEFFDLTDDEVDHLFMPDSQSPERFGGKYLEADATKEEVAANIEAFVAFERNDENW